MQYQPIVTEAKLQCFVMYGRSSLWQKSLQYTPPLTSPHEVLKRGGPIDNATTSLMQIFVVFSRVPPDTPLIPKPNLHVVFNWICIEYMDFCIGVLIVFDFQF